MSLPCLADTDCIQLSLDVDNNLVADIIISPDDGNTLVCQPNGLFGSQAPSPVVTAFPGSPTDGDEIVYQFDASHDWHLRYDASESSAYKWKWAGGAPAFDRVVAEVDIVSPNGSLTWGFASGPEIILPFKGYYTCRFGAAIDSSQTGFIAQVGVAKTGVDPGNEDVAENAVEHMIAVSTAMRLPVDGSAYGTSPTTVHLYRRADGDGSGTARFQHRWLEIYPLKVGP